MRRSPGARTIDRASRLATASDLRRIRGSPSRIFRRFESRLESASVTSSPRPLDNALLTAAAGDLQRRSIGSPATLGQAHIRR